MTTPDKAPCSANVFLSTEPATSPQGLNDQLNPCGRCRSDFFIHHHPDLLLVLFEAWLAGHSIAKHGTDTVEPLYDPELFLLLY